MKICDGEFITLFSSFESFWNTEGQQAAGLGWRSRNTPPSRRCGSASRPRQPAGPAPIIATVCPSGARRSYPGMAHFERFIVDIALNVTDS
ncbi:hypothetical protein KCP73_15390 [Salmonella enterica subsp. enterica]|nr:hypothetical protein KCP73_15390 [Salmonella enterica subsp. enterica]